MTSLNDLERKGPSIVWTIYDDEAATKTQRMQEIAEKKEPIELPEPFGGKWYIVSVTWVRRDKDHTIYSGQVISEIVLIPLVLAPQ